MLPLLPREGLASARTISQSSAWTYLAKPYLCFRCSGSLKPGQRLTDIAREHRGGHDALRHHLQLSVDAYNYGRRLKTLRGLTPYEFICKTWTEQPVRFTLDPSQHTLGPNI